MGSPPTGTPSWIHQPLVRYQTYESLLWLRMAKEMIWLVVYMVNILLIYGYTVNIWLIMIIIWLVVSTYPSEKWWSEWKSVGMMFPFPTFYGKSKNSMVPNHQAVMSWPSLMWTFQSFCTLHHPPGGSRIIKVDGIHSQTSGGQAPTVNDSFRKREVVVETTMQHYCLWLTPKVILWGGYIRLTYRAIRKTQNPGGRKEKSSQITREPPSRCKHIFRMLFWWCLSDNFHASNCSIYFEIAM